MFIPVQDRTREAYTRKQMVYIHDSLTRQHINKMADTVITIIQKHDSAAASRQMMMIEK